MAGSHFSTRETCPACRNCRFAVLYKSSYLEPPVIDYLRSFYLPQGTIETEYLENAYYTLEECRNCGLIFQEEVPDSFLMERLYGKWIDPAKALERNTEKANLDLGSKYFHEITQIISYLNKEPAKLNFLDYGMGWGNWALMAKALGVNAYGSEISSARIEHARSKGLEVLPAETLPDHKFDFINTEQVFEHLTTPLETLTMLKGALAEDGIIKISVPAARNIKKRLQIMDFTTDREDKYSLNPVAPLEHINFFRKESIIKMTETAGMTRITIPLKFQYRFSTDWSGLKNIAKNIAKPVFRKFFDYDNYLFFKSN